MYVFFVFFCAEEKSGKVVESRAGVQREEGGPAARLPLRFPISRRRKRTQKERRRQKEEKEEEEQKKALEEGTLGAQWWSARSASRKKPVAPRLVVRALGEGPHRRGLELVVVWWKEVDDDQPEAEIVLSSSEEESDDFV